MSFIPCGRFSSNSCSYFLQYSLGSSKNPFFDDFGVSCSSALWANLILFSYLGANISFTPLSQFSSKSCKNFLQYSRGSPKTTVFRRFFDGFWDFLQLVVVGETSNIAHVTLAVHTFAGKKEFLKSVQYFFLFRITYTHTHIARQRQILL